MNEKLLIDQEASTEPNNFAIIEDILELQPSIEYSPGVWWSTSNAFASVFENFPSFLL